MPGGGIYCGYISCAIRGCRVEVFTVGKFFMSLGGAGLRYLLGYISCAIRGCRVEVFTVGTFLVPLGCAGLRYLLWVHFLCH